MDQFINTHRPQSLISWSSVETSSEDQEGWRFDFDNVTIQLFFTSDQHVITDWSLQGDIRRKELDPMRQDMRVIFQELSPSYDRMYLYIAILQALERVAEHMAYIVPSVEQKPWDAATVSSWEDILNNPYGLDAKTVEDTAYSFLGQTPEEIVANIPSEWRVIHIESVLRGGHIQRFYSRQTRLREQLEEEPGLRNKIPPHTKLPNRATSTIPRSQIIEDMVRPRVTFHGTPLKNVRSIVRHGFKLPGKIVNGRVVSSPRSGIAFQRGIYSSQSPAYALSFAAGQHERTPIGQIPSMRLFVCATIMGRTNIDKYGMTSHGELQEGYDSHFAHDFEYIVYDEGTILPCYVIHLDLGCEEAKRAIKAAQDNPYRFQAEMDKRKREAKLHPRLDQTFKAPGDIKREKEARKAAAMKWFPYGFGTATGTSFIIEEVGENSDDEEDYGEWQHDRHAYIAEDDGPDDETQYFQAADDDILPVQNENAMFFDRYQTAR